MRVFVDGQSVLNSWVDQAPTTHTANQTMAAGPHAVVVEYYENRGGAVMQFSMAYQPNFGGFVTDAAVTGIGTATAFTFAPDGRMFIAQKDGNVRIFKNGQLLATPFYTVTPVNDYHDRGLLGIALDPNFASNGNVYLSYTYDNNPADIAGPKVAQVIRVTAVGDVADPASKKVLLGSVVGDPVKPSCENWPLTADCIPTDYDSHSIGNIKFGPDGMLYVATGDGASYASVDSLALRSLNIDRSRARSSASTPPTVKAWPTTRSTTAMPPPRARRCGRTACGTTSGSTSSRAPMSCSRAMSAGTRTRRSTS